jgi:hypothetical protein
MVAAAADLRIFLNSKEGITMSQPPKRKTRRHDAASPFLPSFVSGFPNSTALNDNKLHLI